MESLLRPEAIEFCQAYEGRIEEYADAARLAEVTVERALKDAPPAIHQIAGRAKEPSSLLRKVRSRGYADPASEVTDLVGVRVITYFADDVDAVEELLRASYEIDEARTVDKRAKLGDAFGYRSVHLIARAKLEGLEGRGAELLAGLWFEIQIRSVLEHAWAEIEHDVIYKSGVEFPEDETRKIKVLAAQLEGVDGEFRRFRDLKASLIQAHSARFQEEIPTETLDASRLAAMLEVVRPEGRSFTTMETEGTALPSNILGYCLEAVLASGVSTTDDLAARLVTPECGERIEAYASREGITSEQVSHFAVVVLAAGCGDPETFAVDFPDLLQDQALKDALLLRDE